MEMRATAALQPHPLNARIYGDTAESGEVGFANFRASVQARGITQPLLITADNLVVSGHRRLAAARQLGLVEVPVLVRAFADDLAVREELIHSNKCRQKTPEQIAREMQELDAIEKERAKSRQQAGQKAGGKRAGRGRPADRFQENFPGTYPEPSGTTGQTRDRVGQAFGVSGKTAETMIAVVTAIDQLQEEGQTMQADRIRARLNHDSVRAASRAAKAALASTPASGVAEVAAEAEQAAESQVAELPAAPPATAADAAAATATATRQELQEALAEFQTARQQLLAFSRLLTRLGQRPGGQALRSKLRRQSREQLSCDMLEALKTLIYNTQPYADHCPDCRGSGAPCNLCCQRGWLSRGDIKCLSQKDRDALRRVASTAAEAGDTED